MEVGSGETRGRANIQTAAWLDGFCQHAFTSCSMRHVSLTTRMLMSASYRVGTLQLSLRVLMSLFPQMTMRAAVPTNQQPPVTGAPPNQVAQSGQAPPQGPILRLSNPGANPQLRSLLLSQQQPVRVHPNVS